MVSLIKDPKGEKIFTGRDTDLTASMSSKPKMSVNVADSELANGSKVEQLETKIVQLETELQQQKV